MSRLLLIDADYIAFRAAASQEVASPWSTEDGLYWTWHCNIEDVKTAFLREIENLKEHLNASRCVYCLSDTRNFRMGILSSYKSNRSSQKRPLALKEIRRWLLDEQEAVMRPGLEGDDVMGILATRQEMKGEKIIVSIDKDLKGIPGLYCRDAESELETITEDEADAWHLIQTLAGDSTDGYAGCPGIGVERAKKIISTPTILTPVEHEVTRGPRKGEIETRFEETEAACIWDSVVSRFEAAGLTEADALQQARVARILRASDYDFNKKEPILWHPS